VVFTYVFEPKRLIRIMATHSFWSTITTIQVSSSIQCHVAISSVNILLGLG